MKKNIVCDIHLGATNALMSIDEFFKKVTEITVCKKEPLYSIGDNFDFANIKKKNIPELMRAYDEFKEMENVFHIDGNHERTSIKNDFLIVDNCIFAHGDFEFWGHEKAIAYRSKPQGAGLFKRAIVVNMIESFEKGFESKINGEFMERAHHISKLNGVAKYICGHKHLDSVFEQEYCGKKIVVLPRGFNTYY